MLDALLEDLHDGDKRFTVYRAGDETPLEGRLATHDVQVDRRAMPPGGPDPFLVVEADGEFVGAIGLAQLDALLEPPVVAPGEDTPEGYRVLFDVLDETVFTSMERRQLLAVSREIEDRAYRAGEGTLRAGFQTLSTFESQAAVYRELATGTDLDVHVYGLADWTPPEIPGVTYHGLDDHPLERYWVVAYDGGGDDGRAGGLVAEERPDGYRGVWTDDAAVVDDILARLASV